MENNVPQKPARGNSQNIWIFITLLVICCCFLMMCVLTLGSLALVTKRSSDGATASAVAHAATATSAKKAQLATLTAYRTPTATPQKFSLVDPFDSNQNGWNVGKFNDQFWMGESKVEKGAYSWNIQEVRKTFLSYSDFSQSPALTDFDVSVDTKIINGTSGTCSGIIFRKSPQGWDSGGYAISVCPSRQFFVGYLEQGKWLKTSGWVTSAAIHNDDRWNRIQVNARGSRLIYKINDFVVYQMDDTHRAGGTIALFVEVHQGNQGGVFLTRSEHAGWMTLWFDNFSLQGR